MDTCPICAKNLEENEETVTLTSKGAATVCEAARQRNVELQVTEGNRMQVSCRRTFCNKKGTESSKQKQIEEETQSPVKRRSTSKPFSFSKNCIVCGGEVSERAIEQQLAFRVRTFDFQDSILKTCEVRRDQWPVNVKG